MGDLKNVVLRTQQPVTCTEHETRGNQGSFGIKKVEGFLVFKFLDSEIWILEFGFLGIWISWNLDSGFWILDLSV